MSFTVPPHTPNQWQDAPSTATPLDAAHLEAAETDLVNYTQQAVDALYAYTQGALTGVLSGSGPSCRTLGASTRLTTGTTVMKAFPGITVIPGSSPQRLLMLYRIGAQDGTSDGQIYKQVLQPAADGSVSVITGETLLWTPPGGHDYREPGLVTLSDGTIVCVYLKSIVGSMTASDYQLTSRRSSDGGTTWTGEVSIAPSIGGLGTGGHPVADIDDNVYYAAHYADTVGGLLYPRMWKTTDKGDTWTDTGPIVPAKASWSYEEPCLAFDPADRRSLVCTMRVTSPTYASDSTQYQGWIVRWPKGASGWGAPKRVFDVQAKPQLLWTPDGDLICNPAIPSAWSVGGGLGNVIALSGDAGGTWSELEFPPDGDATYGGSRFYGSFAWLGPQAAPFNVAFVYAVNEGGSTGWATNIFWIPVGRRLPANTSPRVISGTSIGTGPPWAGIFLHGAAAVSGFQVWAARSDEGYVTLGGQITPGASSDTMLQLPNQGLGWAPHQDHIDSAKGVKVDTLGVVTNTNANTNPIVLDGIRFKASAP